MNDNLKLLCIKEDNLWAVLCLDYTLATQDQNLDKAIENIKGQIDDYIDFILEDIEVHSRFLERKAAFRYYALYWVVDKILRGKVLKNKYRVHQIPKIIK